MRYVDTSALAKRYRPDEPGADVVGTGTDDVMTSELTRVELGGVVRRSPSPSDRSLAKLLVERDFLRFAVIPISREVLDRATAIMESASIRALDAVHVASALTAGADAFVTFDRRQAAVARELGLSVPEECGV